MKKINIYPTVQFPCQWDDLVVKIGKNKKTIATIYTEKEAEKDNLKLGIGKGNDGIYDIVIDGAEINNEVVRNSLKDLEKRTHNSYKFVSKQTEEDKIIAYSDKLNALSDKYKDKSDCYDFSKIKSPVEKSRVIKSWIGEILYEAITYKNLDTLKSLAEMIGIEIKELIKQK